MADKEERVVTPLWNGGPGQHGGRHSRVEMVETEETGVAGVQEE